MAATSTVIDGEERGDLINFYNNVFLTKLQAFSKKFVVRSAQGSNSQSGSGGQAGQQQPPLSPLPQLRAHPSSPCKKVSDNHSVFIRNLKSGQETVTYNPHSPHKPLTYSFSRSPAKVRHSQSLLLSLVSTTFNHYSTYILEDQTPVFTRYRNGPGKIKIEKKKNVDIDFTRKGKIPPKSSTTANYPPDSLKLF